MSRSIKKVAILGSGIMGSGIACHFANIGCQVLLLDIVPFDLKEEEKSNPIARNRIVNDALQKTIKGKLNPLYSKDFAIRISTGNFDDDFAKIKDCDLIIEAVIERLDIKNQIFEKVEKHRKPGSIVASNTSGIPINMMTAGRSEEFNKNFIGLHFFNPPRYLRLLEIIPTKFSDPEVVDFMMHYGDLYLGKRTVLCKDTPAFIANRVGVAALLKVLELVKELGLTIEETDKLTARSLASPIPAPSASPTSSAPTPPSR
jgi:3-hydroxyacyl-CoA dehydrogenase